MKVRITTLLSLTGVLVAGSAAALVNTQVLSSSALRKSTASEISVADTETSTSPTSSTTSGEVANKFAQLAPIIAASPAQTTFDVLPTGSSVPAGSVTLDVTNGVLSIVSVTPTADWTVAGSEVDEGQVHVKLQSATQLVEFKASLVAGQIVTSVESTDLTTPSSVSGTTQTSVGGDDSDDQNETNHHTDHHTDPQGGQTVSPNSGKSGGGEHSGGGGGDD